MKCPVCWRETPLNKSGNYRLHRAPRADRYTFCPFSSQPFNAVVAEHLESLDSGAV